MPASKKTKAEATAKAPPSLRGYYAEKMRAIDKSLRMTDGVGHHATPLSTGLLSFDWAFSGGVLPSFVQISGEEASGKSSASMTILASAVSRNVPNVIFHDAEGSVTPEILDRILKGFRLKDVFSEGLARYYSPDVLEDFTSHMGALIKAIPDKVWDDKVESWVYSLPKGLKSTTAMVSAMEKAGLKVDRKASTDTHWVVPTEYSGPEAVVILDSWPALIPKNVEEADGAGVGIAAGARALSAELPKFAGRLRSKGVILWSVNQLRAIPMARYGPTHYEPGGNSLRFFTSARFQMFSRAVPAGFDRDDKASALCIEKAADGEGYDRYAFKAINNTKYKGGRPLLRTMSRVWVSDRHGRMNGFDPVFDTLQYLMQTGQLQGSKNKKMKLKLRPTAKGGDGLSALASKEFDYAAFKKLIVAEHFADKDLLASAMKGLKLSGKAPRLRNALFSQMKVDKDLWSDLTSDEDDQNEDQNE